MEGSRSFLKSREERAAAFDFALDVVSKNESRLKPDEALTLRRYIVAAFIQGELSAAVGKYLATCTIASIISGSSQTPRR